MALSPHDRLPTVVDRKYFVRACIGTGASATVHQAIHIAQGTAVALKVFKKGLNDPAICAEIKALQLLAEYPAAGLAQLLEAFELADGRAVLVFPYMPEGSIFEYARPDATKVLDQASARRWMLQLVQAAWALSQRGLVHGDIKPENCLLDAQGNLVLHDFGTVHPKGFRHAHHIPGTELYMAPELLRGEPCSTAQDVWAIGLVFYAMLFANLPWDRALWHDRSYLIFQTRGQFSDAQNFELLTPALQKLLLCMLHPDPRCRATLLDIETTLKAEQSWFSCPAAPIPDFICESPSPGSLRATPSPAAKEHSTSSSPSTRQQNTSLEPSDFDWNRVQSTIV